jgi:hypothetical protein
VAGIKAVELGIDLTLAEQKRAGLGELPATKFQRAGLDCRQSSQDNLPAAPLITLFTYHFRSRT